MKKNFYRAFIGMFMVLIILGNKKLQSQNIFHIRDFKNSLVVSKSDNQNSNFVLSDYGVIKSNLNQLRGNKYIFQGQEYDAELGIYYFPSRIYSLLSRSFFQPDPKSQYFSPYSYVNGDPVNFFDPDGKQGKMLFLHSTDHNSLGMKESGVQDLIEAYPDAYHYPLRDFLENKIPDLPEMDGRAFIITHSQFGSSDIEIERGAFTSRILHHGEGAVIERAEDGTYVSKIDAKNLGKPLKRLAAKNGTTLKGVVVGSCESETAAQALAQGISEGATSAENKVHIRGLKKGIQAKVKGRKSIQKKYGNDVRTPHGTQYSFVDKDRSTEDFLYEDYEGNTLFHGINYPPPEGVNVGPEHMVPSIEGGELQGFMRGAETGRTAGSMVDYWAHY